MKRILIWLLMVMAWSSPALADVNYVTYAAGGPTPCLGCGAVLSTGTVTSINYDWGSGVVLNSGRADGVVVKFTSYFTVPGSGSQTITFYNRSDDGFILKLNGTTVISDWQEQGPASYNGAGTITLVGGQTYSMEVWYYENGGGAVAQLYWNQPGYIQLVPTSVYTLTQPNPKVFGDGGQSLPTTSISQSRQTKIAQTSSLSKNSVYIDNYGDFTSVTIEQTGDYNVVRGINGAPAAYISGASNTLIIKQGGLATPGYNNLAEVSISGVGNILDIDQRQNGKYVEANISASFNDISISQRGLTGKSAFFSITGNNNTVDVLQQGTGNHYVDVNTIYTGSTVTITQDGSAQKLFSLTINSPNVGVTVSQTNATLSDSAAMSITCTTGPCNGYSYTKN